MNMSGAIIGIFRDSTTYMTANNESLSRELARDLERVTLNAKGMKTADILSACDEIESSFVAKLSDRPDLAKETRRRVAESRFDLLANREIPWDMLEVLHAKVRSLGYGDIEREATREIIFARACLRHDYPELAEPTLERLRDRLSELLKTERSVLHKELQKTTEALLKSLKQ